MRHLANMAWNHRDELLSANRTRIGDTELAEASNPVSFGYDAGSHRVFKHASEKTRLYANGFDLYLDSSNGLVRETLDVQDSGVRVALIETRTDRAVSTQVRHQHNDHLGSAILEIDESGETISAEEYHPYGTTALGAARTPKRFPVRGKLSALREALSGPGNLREVFLELFPEGLQFHEDRVGKSKAWLISGPAELSKFSLKSEPGGI